MGDDCAKHLQPLSRWRPQLSLSQSPGSALSPVVGGWGGDYGVSCRGSQVSPHMELGAEDGGC